MFPERINGPVNFTLTMHLFVVLVIVLANTVSWAQDEVHAPCYSCVFYRLHHQHQTAKHVSPDGACIFPCDCSTRILRCLPGVKVIRDGCSCCNICARQLGDVCNRRLRCDESKGFYCNVTKATPPSGVVPDGFCSAVSPKPCHVNGTTYQDGEQFKPDCSKLCTCRNGGYGCVNLCPQEEKPSVDCARPQLTTVIGQCCKEWTCDSVSEPIKSTTTEAIPTTHGKFLFEDDVNLFKLPSNIFSAEKVTSPTVISIATTTKCQTNTTAWSPCSVTCGVGLSVRMTTDVYNCKMIQQTQLCYVRPCGFSEMRESKDNGHCVPTIKSDLQRHIIYNGCRSIHKRHFRFCATCGDDQCCLPKKITTVLMEFECGAGMRRMYNVMWIRKCHCVKNCFIRHTNAVIQN